jgi:hypothetical protein
MVREMARGLPRGDYCYQKSNAKTDKNMVLAVTEHLELDMMLKAQLNGSAMQDRVQSQRTAAVILRAASRNIVFALPGSNGHKARLYRRKLRRSAGVFASSGSRGRSGRLTAELKDQSNSCGNEVLRTLHWVRPFARPRSHCRQGPRLAQSRCCAGYHGPASAEDALWPRLEALWKAVARPGIAG